MKNPLYLLIMLVLFSFPVLASNSLSLAVKQHNSMFEKKDIVGVGEQVLQFNQTLDEAFNLAEKMAKAVVAKKYGIYFEKVEMKDALTGEIKETISSVNAAILKYEVVRKETTVVRGEVVAIVEIKAKYEPVKLKEAMDRFYENKKIKGEVSKIAKQLSDVNKELEEKEILLRELQKINKSSDGVLKKSNSQVASHKKEVARLKLLLANKNKSITEKVDLFDKTVESLRESVFFYSGKDMVAKAKKLTSDAKALENKYIGILKSLINTFDHSFKSFVKNDLYGENTFVTLSPRWSLQKNMVNAPFNGGYYTKSGSYKHKDLTSDDGVKIQKDYIHGRPEDLIKLKYAIFYVINVNKKEVKIPVLLPVETKYGMKYNESCDHAFKISKRDIPKYLCFNFEFQPHAVRKESTINFKQYLTKDSLKLKFPIGTDITVKSRFEIREVNSGKTIFSKETS